MTGNTTLPGPAPASALARIGAGSLRTLGKAFPFLLVVGAWQLWIWIGDVNRLVAPSPGAVVADIAGDPGMYLHYSLQTFISAGIGLMIGTAIGVLVALVTWVSRVMSGLLTTSMIMMYSTPIVATIPIMARVIGYSQTAVLAVAALVSMFPAYVLTAAGLRATPPGSDDVLTVMGAARIDRLLHLAIPSAVPNFLTALRLNAAVAFVAAIIGEYLTGVDGLGWLFANSFARFKMPTAWGAAVLIIIYSVLFYVIASWVEERGLERVT